MASKMSWCFCPTCNDVLVLRTAGGFTRAFPLGNKGRTLIAALVAEAEENPQVRESITTIINECRDKGMDAEPDSIMEQAAAKRVGRPRKEGR
jgi:hypothetical protein